MKTFEYTSLFELSPPRKAPEKQHWGRLYGSSAGLALALIALAYVGAELAGAWGFLAVFAAGLGLRHAEMAAADDSETPSEELINDAVPHLAEGGLAPRALSLDDRQLGQPRVAAGVLEGPRRERGAAGPVRHDGGVTFGARRRGRAGRHSGGFRPGVAPVQRPPDPGANSQKTFSTCDRGRHKQRRKLPCE